MASEFPDYYALLGLQTSAAQDEVRQAYKRESLRSHPDRIANASPEEKRRATEKFQAIADAYYILSDPTRRREYDELRAARAGRSTDPSASANFFSSFANMFSAGGGGGAGTGGAGADAVPPGQRPDAEHVFGDVFEELLRPEVEQVWPVWKWVGAVCGAGLGYIIGNVPGLLVGSYAGNRLGSVRDAKGKSVAAVFSQLGGSQKAEILRALAMKVLGTAGTL